MFRKLLSERAKPFEVLASICAGEKIQDGETQLRPTVPERMRAAETLARKLLPDLAATLQSGPDCGLLPLSSGLLPSIEVARRLAFLLASGLNKVKGGTVDHTANLGP